jgi:hypothetical protein
MAADPNLGAPGRPFHVEAKPIAKLVGTHLLAGGRRIDLVRSGAEGARTPDLVAASDALFQLSYSPAELVLSRQV